MEMKYSTVFSEMLGLLGDEKVQTSVKFVKLLSPHPGSFLKALMPLPMGEGGRRPGEGSVADGAALLGGLSLLATYCVRVRRSRHAQNDSAAEATVIRTNKGSFVSCIPSAMMRKRCASVSNPNTVPVVTTYAFMLEPPNEPGHTLCTASTRPTAAAVLRNLLKCAPACYDRQRLSA